MVNSSSTVGISAEIVDTSWLAGSIIGVEEVSTESAADSGLITADESTGGTSTVIDATGFTGSTDRAGRTDCDMVGCGARAVKAAARAGSDFTGDFIVSRSRSRSISDRRFSSTAMRSFSSPILKKAIIPRIEPSTSASGIRISNASIMCTS